MRKLATATIGVLTLTSVAAFSQVLAPPDPTPRLPAQAGQGLPTEDRQFISRAANLSEAEQKAGQLATSRASDPAVKELGAQVTAFYQKLAQAVQQLAQQKQAPVEPHASKAQWQQQLQQLGTLSGQEFDRAFLTWQLEVQAALVKLFQTEASGSPQADMAKFAITNLAEIQRVFDQAKQLAAKQNIAADTIKPPPQY